MVLKDPDGLQGLRSGWMKNAVWNRNLIVFTEAWSKHHRLLAAFALATECLGDADPKTPSPLLALSTDKLAGLLQSPYPAFALNVVLLEKDYKAEEARRLMVELVEDDEVIEAIFSDKEKRVVQSEDQEGGAKAAATAEAKEQETEEKKEADLEHPTAPSTWQLCFDPETCETYYYDAITGACQWHLPDTLYELEYDEVGQLDHSGESEIPEWYVYCKSSCEKRNRTIRTPP